MPTGCAPAPDAFDRTLSLLDERRNRPMPQFTLADIASFLNLPAPAGAAQRPITGIATLADATDAELSFLGSDRYVADFAPTRAAAVVVQKRVKLPPDHGKAVFLVDD